MTVRRRERGFTLLELLIAMVVFSAVMAGGLAFLRSQSDAFAVGADRMDLLQNGRFAAEMLHRDLRVMGANVPDRQPALIYAGPDVVAFSGDYATNLANDPFAVYHDPDAPAGAVTAPTSAAPFPLPGTGMLFPSVDYAPGGINSSAEVITFYFTPDSSTARADDYALFRQVNAQPAELVSRNLLRIGGGPFFHYHVLETPVGAPQRVTVVNPAALPLVHSVPEHLAATDTGTAARIDSVRAIRVALTATNGLAGSEERTRALSRLVRLPNAGMATGRTCGDEPLLGTTLQRAVVTGPTGESIVRLTWGQATDEAGGERDVIRYVLWRRLDSDPSYGDPYLSIPSGAASYVYHDAAVTPGASYVYQLAAQDCTPSVSEPVQASAVTIP